MEKDLLEVFEDVTKALEAAKSCDGGADNDSQCLEALKRLKNFPISYYLLVSTQIGKRLKSLTKHPRKKIQTAALGVMEIWKQTVIEETSKNDVKNNGKHERTESRKPEAPREQSPCRAQKAQKTEVKVEKKVACIELNEPKLAAIPKTNDQARDRLRETLHEALCKVFYESEANEVNACDPVEVAVTVESVLFKNWGGFGSNGCQKAKYRSLIFNLKDPKNPDFRRKVLVGDIKAERLVDMSTTEMASDEMQLKNKKLEEKALFQSEPGAAAKATTDQFRCSRCGQRKTTYYQMQTRSADEPMTTYVTCMNCDKRWKFC